jgi:hypothetical protein
MRFPAAVFLNEVEKQRNQKYGNEAGGHHPTDDYIAHDPGEKGAARLAVAKGMHPRMNAKDVHQNRTQTQFGTFQRGVEERETSLYFACLDMPLVSLSERVLLQRK